MSAVLELTNTEFDPRVNTHKEFSLIIFLHVRVRKTRVGS